jgi:hypothetical protein
MEKQYKEYSEIPIRKLTEEQKKFIDEFTLLKMRETQKELEKQQTKYKYNQEQWGRKKEKEGWLSSWMGDPMTRETGWADPEFQETLNLFDEDEEFEVDRVRRVINETQNSEQKDAMEVMQLMMQAANKQEKKWVEFPSFEKGDNPMEWLTEFWGACVANRTSDERKLQMLPVVLKGEARRWYMKNRERINKFGNLKRGTDGSFVKEFLEEFAGPQQQYEWGQQLSMLKQFPGESVAKFNLKWKDLSGRTDPGGKQYMPGKINSYLESILPSLQFQVRLRGPKTLDEAMEIARNAEMAYNSTGNQQLVNYTGHQLNDSELSKSIKRMEVLLTQQYEKKTEVCNLCNRPGHYAVNCRTRTINQERKRQGVCFNCNKPGHMKKDCTEKKRISCSYCRKEGTRMKVVGKDKIEIINNKNILLIKIKSMKKKRK